MALRRPPLAQTNAFSFYGGVKFVLLGFFFNLWICLKSFVKNDRVLKMSGWNKLNELGTNNLYKKKKQLHRFWNLSAHISKYLYTEIYTNVGPLVRLKTVCFSQADRSHMNILSCVNAFVSDLWINWYSFISDVQNNVSEALKSNGLK